MVWACSARCWKERCRAQSAEAVGTIARRSLWPERSTYASPVRLLSVVIQRKYAQVCAGFDLPPPRRPLVSGKHGATRLGFVVLLKFYTRYGQFPRNRPELSGEVVEFVARQIEIPVSELESYN
ncbi:DUF4158 domain-containing protein (plasmid) [Streptomyces sp. S501]|nr:DUF4158 domain-containing protein [Streptomyces sp. S501]